MNTIGLKLIIGHPYNFKDSAERLEYIGESGVWHQFREIGRSGVWAEVHNTDLHLLEETKAEIGLEEFITKAKAHLLAFETYWIEQSRLAPEKYPMSLPQDNSGLWWEMLGEFENV